MKTAKQAIASNMKVSSSVLRTAPPNELGEREVYHPPSALLGEVPSRAEGAIKIRELQ